MRKNILILILSLSLIMVVSLLAFMAPVTLQWRLASEPPTLDPALATDTTSMQMIEQLFLGLTDYDDETTEVIPELATSWECSEDRLVWIFHLREDVKWSDGTPVTAHDVEYSIKRVFNPLTTSNAANRIYCIKGGKEVNSGEIKDLNSIGVKAIDDYTVQFVLKHPTGYFPCLVGHTVARCVPRGAIEKYGEKWTEPENIVTNGPYLLTKWAHEDELILEKNPDYFEADKVQIERVNCAIIVEASTAMAMYESGELDSVAVALDDIDRVKSDPVLSKELTIASRLGTYFYGFNNSKPPMDNPLVRKAFSAAIDKQSLVGYVSKGGEIPAYTVIPPGIPYHVLPEEGVGVGYDPEAARKYLADAGYPEGKGLPEVTLMFNTSEGHRKIAQAIQKMWKEVLGVEVNLTNQEWKVYLKTLNEDAPQIFRLGWVAGYPDASHFHYDLFHSTDTENRIKWHNAEYDRTVEEAAKEADPAKRKELFKRAEQILCEEETAIAPIYYYTIVNISKPYLQRTFAPINEQEHFKDWKIAK